MNIANLDDLFLGTYIARYSALAALIFLFYDAMITFDEEVKYIWERRLSSGKLLFIVNRYLALGDIIYQTYGTFYLGFDIAVCSHFFGSGAGIAIISSLIVQVVQLTRIYALYGGNKKITTILLAICLIAKVTSFLVYYSHPLKISAETFSKLSALPEPTIGCGTFFITGPASLASQLSVLPGLICETILLGAILYKGWDLWIRSSSQPILGIIIWDSLYYYFSLFSLLFVSTFINKWAPPPFRNILRSWLLVVPSVVCSRLILHMRHQAEGSESFYLDTISTGRQDRSYSGGLAYAANSLFGSISWI
ncbi:hypothetical protein M422DRAFT_36430 [Sphaerobolus stellatus SS14]|uniref:DUF6533 domain-containing protein n=1 Tax=Sphaerobolus stellatus (strain SS14) TaxID=990650 RepID=A0A0C9UZ83_SPHS4|nr:hypothetical protein M422DRAFT_36430 [Sphaerobolus stellatus SS14]